MIHTMRWFWFLCLTAAAGSDIKTRNVSCRLLVLCGIGGALYGWHTGIISHGAGILAGTAMLAMGKITGGAIGRGDGWFLLASAGYLTAEEVWMLLLGGFGISWILAAAIILHRGLSKGDVRKDTIPFLACLWPVSLWILL